MMYKISAFFAVAPFYDFQQKRLIHAKLNLLVILLTLLYPLGSIVLMILYQDFLEKKETTSLFITETMSYVSYITVPFVTSLSLLFKKNHWVEFMLKMKEMRVKMKLNSKRAYFSKKVLLVVFFLHLVECANIGTHLTLDSKDVLLTTYFYLYETGLLYIILLFFSINRVLQVSYKDLDDKFKEINRIGSEHSFCTDNSDARIIAKLRECFYIYVDLHGFVKDVNCLFGWIVMVIFIYALTNSVDILNWYVNGADILNADLLDLIVTIIFTMSVIISCNQTTNQGKHFIRIAYLMEEHYTINSPIRLELIKIAELAENYLPKYIILGLVDVTASTIISLITTLSTYLLIVIQFNLS
ncbi:unnamed protein product [Phyllotreta striolata]|uniref:Gustatory receptor n=1 Tax=Phyllotreta striolata TaxID=444603 RepID=A0A9N9TXV8_PHYSR|nr:unnamed protein product [Phyllotreta striolata]